MSKSKRLRSAVSGHIQNEAQAAANPRESVTETVKPPSIDIAELVWHLDPYDLAELKRILMQCGDFTNKATLMRAIDEALVGCNL